MKDANPDLWAAFEAFAKAHPSHPGARMTLELAQWIKEHVETLTVDPEIVSKVLPIPVLRLLNGRSQEESP
jgi:hypothetical protein